MAIMAPPTSDSTSQWAFEMLTQLQRQIDELQTQLAAAQKAIENSSN